MSQEKVPTLATSEMVSRNNFEDQALKDKHDSASLVADTLSNPDLVGSASIDHSVDDNFKNRTSMDYSVRRTDNQDGSTPSVRVLIRKQVTAGSGEQAGSVDIHLDGGGNLLHAMGVQESPNGLVQHELSHREAVNAASEAMAVVQSQNQQRDVEANQAA